VAASVWFAGVRVFHEKWLSSFASQSNEYHGYVPKKLTTQEANMVKKNFREVVTVSNN
jgi:hypothetical protein